MITIKQTGLYAHFVDGGRKHAQKNGYSQSGALDWLSFELANAMCGNTLDHPAIEVIGGNFECIVEQDCLLAISGAKTQIWVNNELLNVKHALYVKTNSTIKLSQVHQGWVNYIAFAANLELGLFNGSVCAIKRERIGGLHANGSPLKAGDQIMGVAKHHCKRQTNVELNKQLFQLSTIQQAQYARASMHLGQFLPLQTSISIPIHFSYQATDFPSAQRALFIGSDYAVSGQSDRMGMRFVGQSILCDISALSSQAIANGAIQISGNGLPIVMRCDRQTIGGYPIIATVSKIGLACLAHATAGQDVRFIESSIEESRQQFLLAKMALNAIKANVDTVANEYKEHHKEQL